MLPLAPIVVGSDGAPLETDALAGKAFTLLAYTWPGKGSSCGIGLQGQWQSYCNLSE